MHSIFIYMFILGFYKLFRGDYRRFKYNCQGRSRYQHVSVLQSYIYLDLTMILYADTDTRWKTHSCMFYPNCTRNYASYYCTYTKILIFTSHTFYYYDITLVRSHELAVRARHLNSVAQGPVVQSWISDNPRLKFNLLFQFVYFCKSVYFKTSENTIPTDPDKISEEIFPNL